MRIDAGGCCVGVVYITELKNGVITRRPADFAESIIEKVQWIELAEKVAELIDESFHLLKNVLLKIMSTEIYSSLKSIHHGAHHFEHILHSFCVISDIVLLIKEGAKFFTKPTAIELAIKISRLAAHLLAPVILLADLKVVKLGILSTPIRTIASLFSALQYGLSTINLIWEYFIQNKGKCNHDHDHVHHQVGLSHIFAAASGCAYHSFTLILMAAPPAVAFFELVKTIAGVAQAAFAIYQLLPATEFHLSSK